MRIRHTEVRDEVRSSGETGATAHLRDTRGHLVVGGQSGVVPAFHPRSTAASPGPR